jgi:hypothetical protein
LLGEAEVVAMVPDLDDLAVLEAKDVGSKESVGGRAETHVRPAGSVLVVLVAAALFEPIALSQ